MDSEKLKIATDLSRKIETTKYHLDEARGMSGKTFGIRFAVSRDEYVSVRGGLSPIDPKDLLDLYISKVEKELTALKKEFELL